ncbi:hypothetical protein BH09PSE3_BH09PSE3_15810 [soil metagenome]
MNDSDLHGNVVPLCRRWHVIHELDLVRFAADHAEVRRLCDDLEACADTLPSPLSPPLLQSLCHGLRDFVARYEAEDRIFLNTMFGRNPPNSLARALILHVTARHAADASHALDLVTALDPKAVDHERFSVETLAYMLRCFFDGCRRAMDFEELTILTLGGNRLTPDARELLIGGLCRTAA